MNYRKAKEEADLALEELISEIKKLVFPISLRIAIWSSNRSPVALPIKKTVDVDLRDVLTQAEWNAEDWRAESFYWRKAWHELDSKERVLRGAFDEEKFSRARAELEFHRDRGTTP